MDRQTEFLISELDILAWNASVQRAGVYAKCEHRCEKRLLRFRHDVTRFVNELMTQYAHTVPNETHCDNIMQLCEYASSVGSTLLDGGKYNCGVAQKLLNLTLKYRWCLGLIPEPPHCPVDRIVINLTKLKGKRNWTQFMGIAAYKEVIEAIRDVARTTGLSLARWELEHYSRKPASVLRQP